MDSVDYGRSKAFRIVDFVDYLERSIVIKSIFRKTTGSICVSSFDAGESVVGKISAFDNLIQIIDGKSEIIINDKSILLENGQSIIIPAHASNIIKANVRFKMISTIIKSGYEEIIL